MYDIRTTQDLQDHYDDLLRKRKDYRMIRLPKKYCVINNNTNPLKDEYYPDYLIAEKRLKKSLRTFAYGYYDRLVKDADESAIKRHLQQYLAELLPADGKLCVLFNMNKRNLLIEEAIEEANTYNPDVFRTTIRFLENPYYVKNVAREDRRSAKSFENELKQERVVRHNLDLIFTALVDWDVKCKLTFKKLSKGTRLSLSTIKRYLKDYPKLKNIYDEIKKSCRNGSEIGFIYDEDLPLADSGISTKKNISTMNKPVIAQNFIEEKYVAKPQELFFLNDK